jgi:hypothetical protein
MLQKKKQRLDALLITALELFGAPICAAKDLDEGPITLLAIFTMFSVVPLRYGLVLPKI